MTKQSENEARRILEGYNLTAELLIKEVAEALDKAYNEGLEARDFFVKIDNILQKVKTNAV